jgi:autotransporter-associated beta strand protein
MKYRSFFLALTALVALLARTESADAQTFNWVGDTDPNWGTAANWNPLGPPTSGVSTILTFDALAPTFSDVNNDILGLGVNQLLFGSNSLISYTLSGNTLTFTGSAGGIVNNSAVLQTINLPLTLSSAISITNNGTASGTDLRISGPITLSNNGLTFRGTGDTFVGGVIGGAGGVTKVNAGTLVLGGANTFTGALTINQGSVTVTSGGSLFTGSLTAGAIIMGRAPGASQLTLTAGAITTTGVSLSFGGAGADGTTQSTIDLGTYATPTNVLFLGGNVTYSANGNPLGAVITGTNANLLTAANRTWYVVDSTGTNDELTVLVPITGAGGITKTGTGHLVLGGVNTFTSNLTINQGSVTITAGGVLYSGNATAAAIVMGRGTGASRLTLTSGAITGTGVQVSFGGSGANNTTQSTIDLGSYSTLTTVLNLGGTVTYSNIGNPQGAVITGNNAQIALFGAGTSGGRTFNVQDSTFAADDLTVLVPVINGTVTGSITKTGGGTLVFGATNSYTGATSIQMGKIVIAADNGISNAGLSIATSNVGAASLELRGAVSQTVTGLTFYNSSSAADSVGSITLGDSGRFTLNGNLTVNNNNNPLQALITGSGTSVFTVTGVRTWNILDSTNTPVELLINAPSMVITDTGNQKIGSGTLRIESALSGAGGFDMRVGSLVFAGQSTFTGITTLRGGEFVFDYTADATGNRYGPAADLVLQGGTIRMLGNASADATQVINDVTLGPAFDPLRVEVVGQAGQTTTLDMAAITRTVGANLLDLRTAGTGTAAFRTSSGTAGQVLGFATLDGDFATREAGAGSTRILTFTDYDRKSDLATVVSGDDLSSDAPYTNTLIRSVDLASWRFNAPITQTVTLGGGRVSSEAGILVGPGVGANDQTISGGVLSGNSAGELVLNVTNPGTGLLRLTSLITDTATISKFGPGTLELRGTNDFAGTLRVTAGTVRVAAASGTRARSIGDNALVSIGGGTLQIDAGISARIGGLSSAVSLSNGTVSLGAGSTLILNMSTTPSINYQGAIVGDATTTIIKENVGTWTVSQDNNSGFLGSVVIDRGLLIHGGTGVNGGLRDAASFTIHQDGGLILDDNAASAARFRIGSNAAVTLVGARGLFGGVQAGLMHRADANRNDAEVIGSIALGGGSSVIRIDNTGASNEPATRSGFSVAGGLTRANNATLSVRGTFLGFDGDGTVAGIGSRTRLYFGTTDTASNTGIGTAPAEFGAGVDSGTTRRIIPYIIAEFVGTPGATGNGTGVAVGSANLGNAFATYSDATDTSGAGLRALVIDPAQVQNGSVAETTTFAASTSVDDNIRENLTAGLNVNGSPTVQSLVVHNNSSSTNVSLTGAGLGAVLTVNSGGFLFTGSSRGITLTNFGGGIAVNNAAYLTGNGLGTRHEYIVHAMNTSTTGAVFGSSLVTANADFTKLTFTTGVTNLFQGLVTINEGILEVSANAHLGDSSAASNDVRLAGGTLRIAGTAFTTNARDFELLYGTTSQIELAAAAAHRITGSFTGGGSLRVNTTGTGVTRALQLGDAGSLLTFGDGRGDLIIGRAGATNAQGDFDLSQAGATRIQVDELLIGDADTNGGNGLAQGVLRLSFSGDNMITARSIVVGDNGQADNTGTAVRSSIVLGTQQNVLNADTIIVGGRKANGFLQFLGGTTFIRGSGGAGTRADLYIGDNNAAGTGTVSIGQINASGAGVDWSLNSLVIGRHHSGAGGAQGTLTFDSGVVDAESILLARPDFGGASTADANTTATINVNGTGELWFGVLRQGAGTAVVNVAGVLAARPFSPGVVENVRVNLTGFSRFDSGMTSLTFQSASTVTGAGSLTKIGSGTLYFDGVGTYTGATTLQSGLTVVGATGQINSAAGVTVKGSAGLRVNGSVAGPVTVESNASLTGDGSVGQVDLRSGGSISAGDVGVGELNILGGTTVWNGGSTINFEFRDVAGLPGTGWDYLDLSTSILAINATSLNKINLLVDSWNLDNSSHGGGPGANHNGFSPFTSYSWLFASTAGLSPDLDTAALQSVFNVVADLPGAGVFGSGNPYDSVAAGSFNVVRTGNDLYLNYSASAIPEPSSVLLSMLAAGGLGFRLRRRRKKAELASAESSGTTLPAISEGPEAASTV